MRRLFPLAGAVLTILGMVTAVSFAQAGGQQAPAGPIPRWPDGRVNLGPLPEESGLWVPIDARLSVPDSGPGRGPGAPPDAPRYPNPKYSQVPFQPWARALLDYRLKNALEPHARCKPSGGARQLVTPYGVEFVDVPDLERVYIIDLGACRELAPSKQESTTYEP